MGDMGHSCVEAQMVAQLVALGNSEGRKSMWCGFPKTLECEKWVRFLYNCVAALRAPTFATSPLHLPPQPSAPLFTFTRAPPLGLKSLRKLSNSDPDLREGAEEGRW